MNKWDSGSHPEFFEDYARKSESASSLDRMRNIRDMILRVFDGNQNTRKFDVADIGCNAGGQSLLWAGLGHRVHGLDINEPLLRLAQRRAAAAGYEIAYVLGSATDLPWKDNSMDVCVSPELL